MTKATNASAWNPEQYDRFKAERSRPFFDLLELVRRDAAATAPANRTPMRVVDLGCGTGALTRHAHETLGASETLGIDSSETMLARAADEAAKTKGLRFEKGDLAAFADRDAWDVVLSNAAIHWVPDHAALLARLRAALRPGGQLAVQVPANFDHVSHTLAPEIAREAPFRDALGGWSREASPILAPEEYATLLHRLGFREQHVRLVVYAHELSSKEDVIEWVKGTLLTDYEKRLPRDLFARFVARYREALLPQLADEEPFLYPFKRLFVWGRVA